MVPANTAQMVPSTSISLSEFSSLDSDLLKFFLPLVWRPPPPCGRCLLALTPGRLPPPVLEFPGPADCPTDRAAPVPLPEGLDCPGRLLVPVGLEPGREFCPPLGRLLVRVCGLIGLSL